MEVVEAEGGEGDENVMAVQGDDGQHYVVLEVIQMGEGEKGKGGAAAAKGKAAMDPVVAAMDSSEINEVNSAAEMVLPDDGSGKTASEAFPAPTARAPVPPATTKADVANCFGFDDDDDEDE